MCHVQVRLCTASTPSRRTTALVSALAKKSHSAAVDLPVVHEIASPANSYIKHCCKLVASRAYREEAGSVLIVGHIPIQEVAKHTAVRVLFLAEDAAAPTGRPQHVALSTAQLTSLIDVCCACLFLTFAS